VRKRSLHLLTAAFVAAVASACGAEALPEELLAVPVERATPAGDATDALVPEPPERAHDEDEGTAAAVEDPADERPDEPAEAEGPRPPVGDEADADTSSADRGPDAAASEVDDPTDAAIARFVEATSRGALSADHQVVDVTGDGIRDVLVGTVRLDGLLELVLGRWDGATVDEAGRVGHQAASDLGTLVVRDLDGDGQVQVSLPFVDRPRLGVLVAEVTSAGSLDVPGPCPVGRPSKQAFDFGEGSRIVELGCAAREVRGRDGLVWSDGVFLGAGALGAAPRSGRGG
jgi:hypothetical protein